MIQRIQSILLLISALGFTGQFLTDFTTSTASVAGFLSDQKYEIQDSPFLLALTLAGLLSCLAAIFLYKNRALQIKITFVSIISGVLLPVLAYYFWISEAAGMPTGISVDNGLGTYLPFVSVVCSFLGLRFIKKDDQLVKSMDRLR